MKKNFCLIVLVVLSLFQHGCREDAYDEKSDGIRLIRVSPSTLFFDNLAADQEMQIESVGAGWTISGELPTWVSLDPKTGEIGNTKVILSVKANNTPQERIGNITFKMIDCDSVAVLNINQGNKDVSYCRLLDSLTLVDFYIKADGDYWEPTGPRSSGMWDFSKPINSWHGIMTELINGELRVVGIDLYNVRKVGGIITTEIGNLSELRTFIIHADLMEGNIPDELCYCQKLEVLKLNETYDLSWKIPQDFALLNSLKELQIDGVEIETTSIANLYLAENIETLSIWGGKFDELPEGISNWRNLKKLTLSNIGLTSLPADICNCLEMQELLIGSCKNLISLSDNIGNLSKLEILNLSKVGIKNFPNDQVRKLTKIRDLRFNDMICLDIDISCVTDMTELTILQANEVNMKGDISALLNKKNAQFVKLFNNKLSGNLDLNEMFSEKLIEMDLDRNDITGTLTGVGSLSNVKLLSFADNKLNGEVPSEIGNCTLLGRFNCENNNLTGSIPVELYKTATILPYSLRLAGNRLSGIIPELILTEKSSIGDTSVTRWNHIEADVTICPQQNGYGFSNC